MFKAPSVAGSLSYTPSVSLSNMMSMLNDDQRKELDEKIEIALLEVTLQLNRKMTEYILLLSHINRQQSRG